MPELYDSHAHFEGDDPLIAATLDRAATAGVTRILAVGGSVSLNRGALRTRELALTAPGRPQVAVALGWDRDQLEGEKPDPDYSGVAAVGEIGLDYHYSPETRTAQRELFARQLALARALDKPVIVHTRDADDDTLELLRAQPVRGIIHSFTGSPEFGRRLLDLGMMISISGIVTFRAADNVRATALAIPDDRLLIETDSPYLAPVPMRGQPNEPGFLVHTAQFLATLRGMSFAQLATLTTDNARQLLG